eukprot:jgi/Bigna1/75050/fgenesh1_pg.32_\
MYEKGTTRTGLSSPQSGNELSNGMGLGLCDKLQLVCGRSWIGFIMTQGGIPGVWALVDSIGWGNFESRINPYPISWHNGVQARGYQPLWRKWDEGDFGLLHRTAMVSVKRNLCGWNTSVEKYDLGYLMAPLSRHRLEMVLARVIVNYPEEVERLLEESRKAADFVAIGNEIKTMLDDQGIDVLEAMEHFEHHIKLARNYAKAKDANNALLILKTVTTVSHRSTPGTDSCAVKKTEKR